MKPGKRDIPVRIKISGRQLSELQRHTWHMIEAFGLDSKIDNYKGVRPMSLYSWDLDCILDVLSLVLDDENEYPDKEDKGYLMLHELYVELKKADKEVNGYKYRK
jgi:hypothetical protein